MNFHKNLLKTYQVCSFFRNKCLVNKNLNLSTVQKNLIGSRNVKFQKFTRRKNESKTREYCSASDTSSFSTETEEITEFYPFLDPNPSMASFRNSTDPVLKELVKSASIEDILNFVTQKFDILNDKYLTHVLTVLTDLQTMFYFHSENKNIPHSEFFEKLSEHKEFHSILRKVEETLATYDPYLLSYTILNLVRLGVPVENYLVQKMAIILRDHLLENFSLEISSRLFRVIFSEISIRPYYTAIDLIPKVLDQIDSCNSIRDMDNLSVCLNRMNLILTDNILESFKRKVEEFIENKKLTHKEYITLIKIILLYNYPRWRHKNTDIISKCILTLKDSIGLLNFTELEILFEVFFKNHEPGEVLGIIQRSSAKFLQQLENSSTHKLRKLKLFSCMLYFSPFMHRIQFRNDLEKYLNDEDTLDTILILRRIFSYLKVGDIGLCNFYWDKAIQVLKQEKDSDNIVKLMENYLYFTSDCINYRHYGFEHYIFEFITRNLETGNLSLFPFRLFSSLCFSILYCRNPKLLDYLLERVVELKSQLSPIDCLKISQALSLEQQIGNPIINKEHVNKLNKILREATEKSYKPGVHDDVTEYNLLIKAAILRNDYDNDLMYQMIQECKDTTFMSSKLIKNLCFNLYSTSCLVPEILNKCTEYVIYNKDYMLGFNVDRLLFVIYSLNYYPVHADRFFQDVTDIIIRDQERLSGLSFLQAALSLCYFNKMPKTFIKQIFNVEFLDKLDVELANCYFKDKYPHRVRRALMELNRAVCLEYPEYNVPWFHQKYIDEMQKSKPDMNDGFVDFFQLSVKDYLVGTIGEEAILENVQTPYGYHINFVIHLDSSGNPTIKFKDPGTKKIAILLKYDNQFTKLYVHLKGKEKLKNRHLEILGYDVKIMKHNDWTNLLYASERVEFIKNVFL